MVNGQPVQIDLQALARGMLLFHREDQTVGVHMSQSDQNTCEFLVQGRRLVAKVEPPHKGQRARTGKSNTQVTAPMPGLLIQHLIENGARVEAGQSVLVLESMKMQMQLKAPISGKLQLMDIKPGQRVEKSALLFEIIVE